MNDLNGQTYSFGAFHLDVKNRVLQRNGASVWLAPKEFDTLIVLVRSPGQLLEKETLISAVWPDTFVSDGSLARNISVLRKALGDETIETVPKKGYRFVPEVWENCNQVNPPEAAPVSDLPAKVEPAQIAAAQVTLDPALSKPQPHFGWLAVLVSLAVLALVAGALLLVVYRTNRQSFLASAPPVRLAVLPFVNLTGDPNQEYLCDGMTEAMIAELSRLSPDRLSVIARTSAMHYKGTTASIPQIGRELQVDYVLESSVRGSVGRAHITSQLVRASDATHQWTGEYERDLKDVFNVQQEVAIGIAEEIRLFLSADTNARLRQPRRADPEAYRLYLLGRFYWNKRTRDSLFAARDYFQQSIDRDPQFAKGYAGLADTYVVLTSSALPDVSSRSTFAQAKEAAQHALDLDETLPEAHAALGFVQAWDEWNWSAAEANYRRALALDPNNANAHHWYALYLIGMKRPQEAVREIRHAVELDPLSLGINYNTGFIYTLVGMHNEAVAQFKHALQIDPNSAVTHGLLGIVYQREGLYEASLAEFRLAEKLSGGPVPYLSAVAVLEALAGNRADAERDLKVLLHLHEKQLVPACILATVYAALRDNDAALKWVRAGVEDRSCSAIEINNDAMFDGLRTDPRFIEVQREMKLRP
jgi:TolB-like protein/DNA-binding winged helix-turn-helix (wHTH) protein/tetratricopeptide (TPR) repeat protein